MLRSLYNISIGRRIFFAFTLTTVIALVAISLLSTYYFNALVARDQAVKTAFAAQHTANDQLVNLQRMNALLRTRLAQVFATTTGGPIAGDPSLAASGGLISIDLLTREITFEQTLTLYQQNYALGSSDTMSGVRSIVFSDDPNSGIAANQQAALTTVARSEWPSYRDLQDRTLQLLDPATNPTLVNDPYGAYEQAYEVMFKANALFLTLTNDWQQVVNSAQTIGEIVTNVGPSQYQPILVSTTLALLFTILVIVLTGYSVNLTITKPLRRLVELTQRIAAGENNVRATIQGRDEIARVATSMNSMLDHIVKLIQQSEGQRARLQFQVEQLVNQVSGVGQGDLRAYADATLEDLGILANSFNFMVKAFSTLIWRIKAVAYEVATTTLQIAQSMNQLVGSADQQINQIREASGMVERMASASQHVAQSATALSTVATQARETAREGAVSTQMTVDSIHRVNGAMQGTTRKVLVMQERSSAIGEISIAMGKIAHQTQRLSLDANIQANLSREHNPGYAAIADEIRKLSEQVKKDSERIGQITRTVIGEIADVQRTTLATASEMETMVRSASQTGVALDATVSAMERQAEGIQQMSQVASTQVQSSRQVVEVMHIVSQATRQSSGVIQGVVNQVQRQSQSIMRLRTSVEVFRVREEQNSASSGERHVVNSGKLHE
jgi:methyl-accepting chemotaxis protein